MHWPPGRLLAQVILMLVLIVMCVGALGRDGAIGVVMLIGAGLLLYAVVRALR